jgi:undecaprenyl-diphosphatase
MSGIRQTIGNISARAGRLVRWGWEDVTLLVVMLGLLAAVYGFIQLTDEVIEGDTQTFDEWVLRSLRRTDDPAVPIGPSWMRETGIDASALGSPLVLSLVVVGVVGFMLLERHYGVMWLTIVATIGGVLLSVLLKELIGRTRPTVVPHLQDVATPSFPSGHAMLSAVVYLTLGILVAQIVDRRTTKIYCLACAGLLTFIVGSSRVYLGVHYPTDVLAGWMVGTVWALVCALVAHRLRAKRMLNSA